MWLRRRQKTLTFNTRQREVTILFRDVSNDITEMYYSSGKYPRQFIFHKHRPFNAKRIYRHRRLVNRTRADGMVEMRLKLQ